MGMEGALPLEVHKGNGLNRHKQHSRNKGHMGKLVENGKACEEAQMEEEDKVT